MNQTEVKEEIWLCDSRGQDFMSQGNLTALEQEFSGFKYLEILSIIYTWKRGNEKLLTIVGSMNDINNVNLQLL